MSHTPCSHETQSPAPPGTFGAHSGKGMSAASAALPVSSPSQPSCLFTALLLLLPMQLSMGGGCDGHVAAVNAANAAAGGGLLAGRTPIRQVSTFWLLKAQLLFLWNPHNRPAASVMEMLTSAVPRQVGAVSHHLSSSGKTGADSRVSGASSSTAVPTGPCCCSGFGGRCGPIRGPVYTGLTAGSIGPMKPL